MSYWLLVIQPSVEGCAGKERDLLRKREQTASRFRGTCLDRLVLLAELPRKITLVRLCTLGRTDESPGCTNEVPSPQ